MRQLLKVVHRPIPSLQIFQYSSLCTFIHRAVATGGYRGAPPQKNTILGRYCLFRPCCRRFSEKSAVPPPRRMVQGGGWISEPFFENRRHGLERRYVTEKVVKKGGTPFLGTFWRFWGFPVKTVGTPGLPWNPSQQRKRYTTHRGSSQRYSRGSILYSLRV